MQLVRRVVADVVLVSIRHGGRIDGKDGFVALTAANSSLYSAEDAVLALQSQSQTGDSRTLVDCNFRLGIYGHVVGALSYDRSLAMHACALAQWCNPA